MNNTSGLVGPPSLLCSVPGGTVAGTGIAWVKDGQSCRYTPPYALLVWFLTKYTVDFISLQYIS